MQFARTVPWLPDWGICYRVGPGRHLALAGAADHGPDPAGRPGQLGLHPRTHERPYYALLLTLLTGMLGVFVALDLFLFYVFWEVMLIPMYFIIGIWGGDRAALRGDQVLRLHLRRVAPDAGGDPGHGLAGGARHRQRDLRLRGPAGPRPDLPDQRPLALRRLRAGLRHQGAGLPVPHLASRRPRRRRPPPAACSWPACCSRWGPTASCGSPSRFFPTVAFSPFVTAWRSTLAVIGIIYGALVCDGAAGRQEAGGLLLRQPPRLRDARHLVAAPSRASRAP